MSFQVKVKRYVNSKWNSGGREGPAKGEGGWENRSGKGRMGRKCQRNEKTVRSMMERLLVLTRGQSYVGTDSTHQMF